MKYGKRVVIFTETFLPRVDGIVNTLRWILRCALDAGWEPMVVAPSGNTGPMPGVRVVGAPSVPLPMYREVRVAVPHPAVVRQIDEFAPDVVHLAGPVTNGFAGLCYAQARMRPLVSTFHTSLPEYARLYGMPWLVEPSWRALRAIHNRCAVTLCPSRVTVRDLRERGFERVELWSRGVDADLFTPERRSGEARQALGARNDDDVVVVYVGRLAREKKLDRLLRALRLVDGVRAAFVGDGPDRERLEALSAGLPVRFLGTLHGPALAAAYAAGDVFAFPSDTETFGNVVLEAMACGLPVVATDVGGQVDLVSHDRNGLLFEPENVEGLATHLRSYRDDRARRAHHGQVGRRLAAARSWPRQVAWLLEHYEWVSSHRSEQTPRLAA